MIICICNNISTSAVTRDPSLLAECGTQCGTCILWLESTEGQQFTQQLNTEACDAGFFILAMSSTVNE